MSTTLAALRAQILEAEAKKQKGSSGSKDNLLFPLWDIPDGTTATIRFLPDKDASNISFWRERMQIKLPFVGIKGKPGSKPTLVTVPCVEMWGDRCPVQDEIRPWYKKPELVQLAGKYWKKRQFLMQGFVRANPISTDTNPPTMIRKFIISKQLHPIILQGITDPTLIDLPTHYENGLDFIIRKMTKGGFADYTTSGWARRESALTNDELEAIEAQGLYDLNEWMPKKPTSTELAIIMEMFEASLNGEEYDPERWANYYKPFDLDDNQTAGEQAAAAQAAAPAPAPAPAAAAPAQAQSDNIPFDMDEPATPAAPAAAPVSSSSAAAAKSIIDLVRSRSANNGANNGN